MNINFDNEALRACQTAYNSLDPEKRLVMSHFDLAKSTEINDLDAWLDFLKDPRVSNSINEELQIYKEAQQRKLIQRATTHDKSVGTAQMINALNKTIENDNGKSGEFMIYTYVPMNAKETESPNAAAVDADIFEK